jgi:hypothetical protein
MPVQGEPDTFWGDRYWSRVLEGEPPERAEEVDWTAVNVAAETGTLAAGKPPSAGVSSLAVENPVETGFSPKNPVRSPLRLAKYPRLAHNHTESPIRTSSTPSK